MEGIDSDDSINNPGVSTSVSGVPSGPVPPGWESLVSSVPSPEKVTPLLKLSRPGDPFHRLTSEVK